eukprot:gene1091-biopygen2248
MQAWLTAQQPPSDPAALVDNWWPAFKAGLVPQVQHLNHQRQQQQQNTQAAVQRATAAAAVHAAHQQLAACDQPAVPAALDALVTARHAFASIQASEERVAQQRRRQQWVHNGERPGPLYSRLYSAIGSVNRVPAAFLDGMIVPVLKPGGILVDVDSYRPLQMLSYDYRLLAKMLANRLASAANSIIDPAQCAFVPRRSIGDSIRLLQLLAPMLHAEQRAAVVAFLDFRKAYDTVDREFLCSVAATLGAVDTFVSNMQVFGAASGQHLQPAKCSLLPVGVVPPAMSALPQQS